MPARIARPDDREVPTFHRGYLAAIADEPDALEVLGAQLPRIRAFGALPAAALDHRYAEDKWTVREVLGHLVDGERVLAYRLLCTARGETAPLPTFDERAYAARSNAGRRGIADLVAEAAAVRESTIALARSLDDGDLDAQGRVGDWIMTPRLCAFIVAGHWQHHANVLQQRYDARV